ncbi:MAG: hypothetical protein BWY69_01585 [Planctomycetes bacterium ADurb.Bin401]|nr:MAG: hypothetical protein BWY69_01585 [Planctomycetes bacterium ADurb.Bin401]
MECGMREHCFTTRIAITLCLFAKNMNNISGFAFKILILLFQNPWCNLSRLKGITCDQQ